MMSPSNGTVIIDAVASDANAVAAHVTTAAPAPLRGMVPRLHTPDVTNGHGREVERGCSLALVNDLTGSAEARSRVGVRASPTALPSSGSIDTSVPRDCEKDRRLRHRLARATSPCPTHTTCALLWASRPLDQLM